MEEALRFLRTYELWVYVILGLGGLIYFRKFVLAWGELRDSAFGLERENAQGRLNQASIALVLILGMAITVFFLISFIAPSVPGAIPLLTPTLDLMATPSTTLLPETPESGIVQGTPSPTSPLVIPTIESGCIAGQITFNSPEDGSEIGGIVEIIGTANIPNFGFYKLEMKRPDETTWQTILAGNEPKTNALLGSWNTSLQPPGIHQLGLVVTDNQGQPQTPCIIQVRLTNIVETPQP